MRTMRFTNALVGTAVIVGVMSVVSLAARAQNVQSKATVDVKPAVAQAPSGGMRDGLKVHGHWTIDVRNPNGTLASHREFENSLVGGSVTSGAGVLAHLLTGPHPAPTLPYGLDWAILLNALDGVVPSEGHPTCLAPGTKPDGSPTMVAADCLITKLQDDIVNGANRNGPNSGPVHNLTFSIDPKNLANDSVRLDGYITAGYDGSVTQVVTRLGGTFDAFSSAVVAPPISVLFNQVITVAVVFTFS